MVVIINGYKLKSVECDTTGRFTHHWEDED